MLVLVDTSAWSLLLRRDSPPQTPQIAVLRRLLEDGDRVATTGVIVQELLHGFPSPAAQEAIATTFRALEYLTPTLDDHIAAAGLRNTLRANGIQLGAIDALIAHLAISRNAVLLTTDADFSHAARHSRLRVWEP